MRRAHLAAAMAGLFAALSASFAWAGGNPDYWCRNGAFARDERPIGLARISANGRVHFTADHDKQWRSDPGCLTGALDCVQRAYLARGDLVLTGHTYGDYVCVYFPNRAESAGWIRARDLAPVPVAAAPPLHAWAGDWRYYDDQIRLSVRGHDLTADGEAYWPGKFPDPEKVPGGRHEGGMGGTARPTGALAVFNDDDGCRVELQLVGPYLVAGDNGRCGGMNVRFDGVYRRK